MNRIVEFQPRLNLDKRVYVDKIACTRSLARPCKREQTEETLESSRSIRTLYATVKPVKGSLFGRVRAHPRPPRIPYKRTREGEARARTRVRRKGGRRTGQETENTSSHCRGRPWLAIIRNSPVHSLSRKPYVNTSLFMKGLPEASLFRDKYNFLDSSQVPRDFRGICSSTDAK